MRIQKYLSEQGICSRREAEEYISRGFVTVNGTVIREMGVQIDPATDTVELLHNTPTGNSTDKKTTVILNKPRGIVCSRNSDEGKTVFDLFPQFESLNIVGRLDKESDGLLLISDDGVIARKVTGDKHETEKEYEVRVQEHLTAQKIAPFEQGVVLEDGPTLPAQAWVIDNHTFRIILREGRKHQIRRMCESVHLTVTNLTRVRIGSITLGDLKQGAFRKLSSEEAQTLRTSVPMNLLSEE